MRDRIRLSRPIRWRITHPGIAFGVATGLTLALGAILTLSEPAPESTGEGTDPGLAPSEETMSEDIPTLPTDHPLEGRLPPSSTRTYRLSLAAGHFVSIGVEQRGLDVLVRLFGPDGDLITEVDSPIGDRGVERVLEVAQAAGIYRIEVASFSKASEAGTYSIAVEELRPATEADRTRVTGERSFARGEGLRRAKRPTEAIPEYEQALEAARALDDRAAEARALYRLGWMHHDLETPARAIEPLAAAVDRLRELGDSQTEAPARTRLGRALLQLGRPGEAEPHHRRALELFGELDDERGQAAAANNLGNVYKWTGRTADALAAYERAVRHAERAGQASTRRTARLNIGDVYLANDDGEAARVTFEGALEDARAAGDRATEATCLLKLGESLASLDRLPEALGRVSEALAIRRDLGQRRNLAVTLTSLGTLHIRRGDLDAARAALEEALALFEEVDDPTSRALVHHKLGRYHYATGELDAAKRQHELALPLFLESGDRQGAASTRYGIARALFALEDYAGAQHVLEEVLDSAESLRTETARSDLRGSYLASRRHYWDLVVTALMRQHAAEPDAGFDVLALQRSERWRARGLLELLSDAGIDAGAPPELLERMRRLTVELDALDRARLGLDDRPPSAQTRRELADRQIALSTELNRTRAEIQHQGRSDRHDRLSDVDPLELSRLRQSLLDEETVVVTYHLTDYESYAWTISTRGIASHSLPPRSEIDGAASEFAALLPRLGSRARVHRSEAGARLARMVLAPLEGSLDAERLAIVADGGLHYVPFAALPVPEGVAESRTADGDLLLDRYEVVNLPSASVLSALRDTQYGRSRAPKTLAVIADPVFGRDDPRLANVLEGTGTDRPPGPDEAALTRALRSLPERRGGLRRLQHSAEEAHALRAMVPEDSRFEALGFDAALPLLDGDRLADYQILHFATHGLVDRRQAELSGLVLSLFDRQGRPTAGFLRLHQIYDLELSAELVVLSACETGLGEDLEGEGLVGLTRGFLYAGAPRIVHSLWKVGDESAAELMKRFYAHLLAEEDALPPAAALRAAQRSMRDDPAWSDPFHWAAFVFQGDWQVRGERLGEGPIEESDTGGTESGEGVRSTEDLPIPPPEAPPKGYAPPPPPPFSDDPNGRGGDT